MTFYTFANATSAIPLANLDANFATPITLGNTAVTINGTFSSIGNLTLNNATIASGNSTVTKETVTTITSPAATNLTIQSAGTTAMTIDTSQNVGIGRAPNYALDVYRSGSGSPAIASANDSIVTVLQSVGTSQGNIGTLTSHPLAFIAGNTERMRIDSSGNVGISAIPTGNYLFTVGVANGQTAASKGSIINTANIGASGGDYPYIGYNFRTTLTNGSYLYNINDYAAAIKYGQYGGITFHTAASGTAGNAITWSQPMTIDSSGNLLVGTTTQVGKLNVVASSNIGAGYTQYLRNTWSGDVGYPGIYLAKYDNNTTTSQIFVRFSVNNEVTASGQINANGANSAAFGSFSDRRLKENIVDLSSQLANICSLRPAEFDFKDGSGHQIGFIAQEMQEVYPDVVGVGADDMLTITGWSKTEARLVKAIQELKAEFDAYKASHP